MQSQTPAQIFDTGSQRWITFTPDGGVSFSSDRAHASTIDGAQLDSYIRNYELEYLRNSLVLRPVDDGGGATVSAAI